jgi:uncharacterized protein (DUF2141 family)
MHKMMRVGFQARIISATLVMLSFFFTTVLSAEPPNSATLTIRIINARNANGLIRIALFESAEGFPGDSSKALRTQPAKIDPQTLTAQAVFTDIPRGTYAVILFHDENGNGKLDKNLVGIPKEGYGASNNPTKKMRPPAFDEAKFSLASDQSVEVKLVY